MTTWPPQYDDTYLPPNEQEYWFPDLETETPSARIERVLEKVRGQMAWAYERSPFYKRIWDAAGVAPAHILTLDDFHRVPIITKDDMREDLIANPPFGSNICDDWSDIERIHGSSGTTGIPTVLTISRGDWQRIGNAHARVMWAAGIRPTDMVFMASPFSLYMGSWGALVGTERIRARSFPFGAGSPGQTKMAVRWIQATSPTVFYGTPSFALYIAETAREQGIDPKSFGFRTLFFSGEPGASIPATREMLQATFGATIVDMGSTGEMSPWMTNGGCAHSPGMHLWQDIVYTELVDPVTKEVVPYGSEGVPVYTHLERTSQPLIRFWSGDISRWTDEPCPCGRTYPRLPMGIYGRVDDMVTVRGENVYPSAVENVVRGMPGLTGEFRMIVSRERVMDELTILAEYATGQEDARDDIKARLEGTLAATLGIRAAVDLKSPGELERTQFKAKRVIDERDLHA
ncbi:MAG: phenylacetate--CoA ligase family protein [Chloroflexi bacterium]|nr:phenylacetate--CoA ligase family protein [Chloroflexota bacterium]MDA1173055.1 phenylacetate--CoA ligase family protein [Chloroflexota bacterium]